MNEMRRNRRCYREQKPVPKKLSVKILCRLLFVVSFGCLFTSNIFSQLIYDNLIIQYDSPWVYKNLKLIPVRFKEYSEGEGGFLSEGVISFEQAFREGKLSVKETSLPGGSDVGLLEVKNHSKKNVLVHSGEIVTGGKQDRAFATTTIIPPETSENYVPVFCIEKGRWDDRVRSFRYEGTADISLRKQIDVTRKQNEIWKEIDRQLASKNMQNKTWAYIDLFRDTTGIDTGYFHFFNRKMKDSDSGYAGFVALTDDRIINCELFGNSDLCLASYDAMLKSYVRSIEQTDDEPDVPDEQVVTFLNKFLRSEDQQKKFLTNHGRMYLYQNHVIHLVAYDD